MQWPCVIHSTSHHHRLTFHIQPRHFRHSTAHHMSQNSTQYHQITHHMAVVWNVISVLWDSGMCNLYLNVVVCAWRGVMWNVGVMWNGVPRYQ